MTEDHGAVLMVSSEPFLLQEAEKDLRDRLIGEAERDFNYLALYGWEAELPEVLGFLQTLPFLGARRLLVIREVQKFAQWKHLLDYLKDPNPSSVLLMTTSEMKRSEGRYKALSAHAHVTELRRPYGRALVKWVGERFKRAGKTLDPGLSEILIQIAGEDLGILATEIDKIALGSGTADVITQEDLSVSVPGGVEVVFNLLDALGEKNGTRALASLRTLLNSDNPPEYLIHMMAWHYRQLLRGRELVNGGLSTTQAAVKMGKKFSGIKEKFARQLGRATQDGLVRAMEALSDCDRELKSGRIPPEILLDRLVLELLV